jgi:hypothetical protein
VVINSAPAQPVITGDSVLCTGTQGHYTITPINGATGYTWTVPAGGTIVSGQNTTALTVNWTAAPGGPVCASALNTCGTGGQACFPVVVYAQPVAHAGADSSVCGTVITLHATLSTATGTGVWSTVSGLGTVSFSNAGAANTTATASANGIYLFQWKETNGICTSVDTVQVHFNASPVAGQIQSACDASNQHYTISFPITGGTTPYTVPGGTVTGSQFTSNLVVSGQPYSFVITDANGCVSQAVSGLIDCNCTTNAGQMSLTPLTACPGGSVTAQQSGGQLDGNDVGAYALHTNSGPTLGTILSENTTGTFSFGAGMTYGTTYYISYVVGNNLNGLPHLNDPCLSVAQGQPVSFYDNPVANAGVDTAGCGLTLTVHGNTGGAGSWTVTAVPAGGTATLTSAQSSVTDVTASLYGLYTLTYTLNDHGCLGTDAVVLNFEASPAAGPIARVCDGANQNYTVSFPISGGSGPYSVNGAPVVGTNFDSAPVVSGSPYTYVISDANGCVSPNITGTFNCNCATNAGLMSQSPLSICAGGSITAQLTGGQHLDANDTTAFVLHTGSGTALGTIIDQNTTGTFSFVNGMSYGVTYYVSAVAGNNVNGAPDPNDPCFSVAQGQPVVFYQIPVADPGTDHAACGNALNLNGVGAGTWSVVSTPAGGNLTFNDIHNPGAEATASVSGVYKVAWTISQNGCPDTAQVNLTFHPIPTSGTPQETCDNIAENYTVVFSINGGTTPYTVNGTILAGTTFTSTLIPNGQLYNFAVVDNNGCTMPDLAGSFACSCLSNAGTMSAQTITVCEGGMVTAQPNANQTLDGNDVFSYVLHSNSGTTLGQIFAANTTGVFSFQTGMVYGQTYYISRVVGNSLNGVPNPSDPCFSVAAGQPVVFLKNPTPDAGPSSAVCGLTASLSALNGGFAGQWTTVSGPGTAAFANTADPDSKVTADKYGSYVFQWTETNSTCVAHDTVTVVFHDNPVVTAVIDTCNGTNTGFTVSFTVTGGTAPFNPTGLGGTFAGNVFTSTLLGNNANYSFILADANGCSAPVVSGSHHCSCTTFAGTMNVTPLTFCADQPATATWNNNATLDADDIVQFILHNQSGGVLGTIYRKNAQPVFSFGPGLQTGVVYYISAIAGNAVGSTVNVTDPCLSIAPGTPVMWKPLPTAALTGDATICNGSSTVLTFSGTGVYPLHVSYTDASGAPATLDIPGAQPVTLTVSPTTNATYTLTNVTDGTLPACAQVETTAVTVQVSQPVNAGVAHPPLELCAGTALPIQLTNLLTGADFGGQWTETSAVPSLPGAFNATTGTFTTNNQPAGTYTFKYVLTAQPPCQSQASTVTVILDPLPKADAGQDVAINCNQPAVSLGGPGTSTGPGYVYNWTSNGVSVGHAIPLFTGNPGTYTLVVTSPAGCVDSDAVSVIVDNQLPKANIIKVHSVRCFGDKDGKIVIDSIVSAHSPVLLSLNGGPFSTKSTFSPLLPGKYTVTLQDANGCEWTTDTLVVSQPPQLTVDLGATVVVDLGDTVRLKAQISVPFSSIHSVFWNPVVDTLHADSLIQYFRPFVDKLITVRITDTNGCIVNGKVLVVVTQNRHVFIPNVIKPTSNFNGLITVYGGKDVDEVESFQVFDRWGDQMYETLHFKPNDPSKGWNGRYKGEDVGPGVYVYYAVVRFVNGEKVVFTGDVTVIR